MGDNTLDYEKLNIILERLSAQRERDNEFFRNLVVTQINELRNDMKAQHTSIRGTLTEQNITVAGHVKTFLDMFRAHEAENDETKEKVLIQGETIKRFIWLGGLVIPGAYLLWEFIKVKLHIT